MYISKRTIAATTLAIMVGVNVLPFEHVSAETADIKIQLKEKKNEMSEIKSKKVKLYEEIKELDQKVEEQNLLIREKEEQINVLDKDFLTLQGEKSTVQTRIEQRSNIVAERLRAMQSHDKISYLDVLLGSRSFGDFISRVSAITTLISADNDLLTVHQEDMNLILKVENDIKDNQTALKKSKYDLEALQTTLDKQIEGKKELIRVLSDQEGVLEEEIYELTDKATGIVTKDAPLLQEGTFINPTNGVTTSEFGMRTHPIFGTPDFHPGIDIANAGTSVHINAAAEGEVTRAEYLGGYGNVVFIKHEIEEQTFMTVYAHLEGIKVEVGQKVKQGEFIGYMGTTGNSTGQHLHFEIHVGLWSKGQPNAVNPRIYIRF